MKIKQLLSKILPTQLVNLGSKGFLENLELRVMMSADQDPAGWTTVTPSSDSRIVHVSSSSGSDTNDGSANAPVKTLAKAMTLMRANMPITCSSKPR